MPSMESQNLVQAQRPLPMPLDIKMIISDVDGTLLDSHHKLPPTNPTAVVIRRLRKAYPDLPIIISTGKQYTSTPELRELLDLHKFNACHLNGNVIYNPDGTILSESGIDVPVVRKVYQRMKEMDTSFFVYDYTTVYQIIHGTGDNGEWAQRLRGYGEDVKELRGDAAEEFLAKVERGEARVIKMAICRDEMSIAEPKKVLLSEFAPSDFALTQALTFCIEFIPALYNKGTALTALLKHLNSKGLDIPAKNVIAFGDGENDVSMFKVAGMSVAMGNAMESARNAATWTTLTNDEGGVGRFLEKVFFPIEN